MVKVLLSLDLIDATKAERDGLYDILAGKNWLKTHDVDTVWTLSYSQHEHSDASVFKKIRDNIANVLINASSELRLKRIYYVAQLGNHEVIAREISKVDGQYKCTQRNLYPE